MIDSLAEPLQQIMANTGHDPDAIAALIASWMPGTGFDINTDSPRDMLEIGIVDTAPVVSQAIVNAAKLTQRLLLLT